ncbi:MAG: RnfABCDGE type electron transport complex subunit B [Ruminococcaceae bacterium]|nr:RnfABCDGE type electron transport complex subunit B [Oscillospiraceae bacterium]
MIILIPVLICLGIAVVCAVILTVTSVFFSVKEDEKAVRLRDCLAGANCGACGYSGCDGYAKALYDGSCDKVNLCTPGGDAVAKELSEILGVEAQDVVEQVAYVACNGNCDAIPRRYNYQGIQSCKAANMNYSGDKFCTYACLGYGDCAAVCPNDAIEIKDGVAQVISRKCIGCGMCARACPNGIIHLIADVSRVAVVCSNKDKGALTRKYCNSGCIGCGMCKRHCPEGAISIENNLAVIDYEKCSRCGKCTEVCPVGCIKEADYTGATKH